MRILAIETSTNQGSVALLEQCELVHERSLPSELRTAQSLAPAIQASMFQADWQSNTVDLVAVTSGPGSFTGLRIAVTTAKTLAYATGAQLIALNTLAVLVEQLPEEVVDACAVMDAQRRQLFATRFKRGLDQRWNAVDASTRIVYPDGAAAHSKQMPLVELEPSPEFTLVAQASGAFTRKVEEPGDLPGALTEALEAGSSGRQALLDVRVEHGDRSSG